MVDPITHGITAVTCHPS